MSFEGSLTTDIAYDKYCLLLWTTTTIAITDCCQANDKSLHCFEEECLHFFLGNAEPSEPKL